LAHRLESAVAQASRSVVVAIDGRSGSGKSSFADQVSGATRAPIVRLEDLYPGWDGLEAGITILVSDVLIPIREGRPATVPQWDWYAGTWGTPIIVEPPPLLIVEGVGAGAAGARPFCDVVVWLELADEERRRRALARDGAIYEPHWDEWAEQEERLLRRDAIPDAAHLVLSTADPEVAVRA
jgi:uridine kinase